MEKLTSNSAIRKKLLLFCIAVILVFIFFFLPRNQVWFNERIVSYYKEFGQQSNHMDYEYRRINRWGKAYIYSKQIAGLFESRNNKNNVLVLLPSSAYFKTRGVEYEVPEPLVFYYYTGLKTTWVGSNEAVKANWYVTVKNKALIIDSVTKETYRDSIGIFGNSKPPL